MSRSPALKSRFDLWVGLSLLAALAGPLAPSATCQSAPPDVSITGLVVPTPGPIGCGPATHLVSGTNVFLWSDTVSLDASVGKLVQLLGIVTPSPSSGCHVIKVALVIDTPPATLEWCGSPQPGCSVKFRICPAGLSQYWLFASMSQAFKPLSLTRGTWLLGDPSFLVAQGSAGMCGEVTFVVPPLPSTVGINVWVQGARRDIGPVGPVSLTNVVVLTLMPVGPPCVPPGC